jgi:rubredoxin
LIYEAVPAIFTATQSGRFESRRGPAGGSLHSSTAKEKRMQAYECTACGYVYDPEQGDPDGGVQPGTPFGELPDDWVCPKCGIEKDMFEPVA